MFPAVISLSNHELTIRLSADGFSYSVYDLDNIQFVDSGIVFESGLSLEDAISRIETDNSCSIKEFNKIHFIFDSSCYTLVPQALYQDDRKDRYLDILGLKDDDNVIVTDRISHGGINNVYQITRKDFDTVKSYAQKAEFHHASSVIVSTLINDNMERTDDVRVYLNIRNQSFEIIVFKGCDLLFDNNFRFKTKEDFLYFLLFSMEQLHLDAETVPVYFLGMIEDGSTLMELTSRYIRNVCLKKDYNVLYKSIKCEL